jgi:hypothetical protein
MLALRRRVAAPDGTAARQGNEAMLHSMLLAGVGTSRPQKLQRRLHKGSMVLYVHGNVMPEQE